MNPGELSTREKIMHATVEFIEKYGIHEVTTRGIAKEANVNSAAINYYFGTKERLLEETLKMTLQNIQEDFADISGKEGQMPGDILQRLFYYFLAGSMKFPEMTKAHLYDVFVHKDHNRNSPALQYFESFLTAIEEKIKEASGNVEGNEEKLATAQLFSAVLLPCLFPELFRSTLGLDFKDDNIQKEYITSLKKGFCQVEKELGSWHPLPME